MDNTDERIMRIKKYNLDKKKIKGRTFKENEKPLDDKLDIIINKLDELLEILGKWNKSCKYKSSDLDPIYQELKNINNKLNVP